jgi:hypothetical protein
MEGVFEKGPMWEKERKVAKTNGVNEGKGSNVRERERWPKPMGLMKEKGQMWERDGAKTNGVNEGKGSNVWERERWPKPMGLMKEKGRMCERERGGQNQWG